MSLFAHALPYTSADRVHGHQITRFWVMNCYLVEEADGFTLIDTLISGSAKTILAAAQKLGHPIRRVLLTHAHTDHIGSWDELAQALPDAEFIAGAQSARFMQGDLALSPGQAQVSLQGGFVQTETAPRRTVADGEKIGSLRVIAAPGHSPDHLAFLDERDGTLYTGDAFQTQGGLAVAGDLRWRFPLPGWATWHKPTAQETAKNLAGLEPTRLAPGHGNILTNPTSDMNQVIERFERKLQSDNER